MYEMTTIKAKIYTCTKSVLLMVFNMHELNKELSLMTSYAFLVTSYASLMTSYACTYHNSDIMATCGHFNCPLMPCKFVTRLVEVFAYLSNKKFPLYL